MTDADGPEGLAFRHLDATLSERFDTDAIRALYALRGEMVSIGGVIEFAVGVLAHRFCGANPATDTSRLWSEHIKPHLRRCDLTDGLQPELAAVQEYFRARMMAAHANIVALHGYGEDGAPAVAFHRIAWQRTRTENGEPRLLWDTVHAEALEKELATVKAGLQAIVVVANAMDEFDPAPLADSGGLTRAILLRRS